jgi:hypothetical protein
MRQRPAFIVSAALFAAAMLLADAYLHWSATHPSARTAATAAHDLAGLYPPAFANNALQIAFALGAPVAIVLGAIVFGSDYGWGTVKTLLTQRPGRMANLAGRLAMLGAGMCMLAVVIFAASATGSLAVALLHRQPVTWPAAADVARALGGTCLALSTYALLGAALGVVFRQAAAAVGVSLIYVVLIERVIVQRLSEVGWSPAVNAGKLFVGVNAGALAQFVNTGPPPSHAAAPAVSAGQAVLTLAAYALLFIAVSAGLVWRRDVT